jgi:hypothetical protein
MNRRDLVSICLAFLIILWLAGGSLPYKLAVLEAAPRVSYDTFIASQEFLLEKKRKMLEKSKTASAELKVDINEQLAHFLWSDRKLDEALGLYKQVKSEREKLSKGYDQKLINTLIGIAGLYRDMNRLHDSNDYYETVWQLDKAHLPANDLRLARDQSSMAVIAYIRGDLQQDSKKHIIYLNKCLDHINCAQTILQSQKTLQKARLANLLYLKYLAFRELNKKVDSQECRQAADSLTKQLNRPYVIPWT